MGIILTILCFGVAAILYILLGGILKKFKPLNFGLFGLLFVVGALVSLYIGDNVRMTTAAHRQAPGTEEHAV